MLMYHADAELTGIPGRWEADFLSVHVNRPGIGRHHPGGDVHQGGFARPILAHQGVHFAGGQ
jgi:hypothetical protein